MMVNHMYERLVPHVGHKIEVASYGDDVCVSVECIDCDEVIVDAFGGARLRWRVGGRESTGYRSVYAMDGAIRYSIHTRSEGGLTIRAMRRTHDRNEPEWVDEIPPASRPTLRAALDYIDNLRSGAEA